MINNNPPLSEQFYEAAKDWTDKEAAASLLEDTKSAVLAEWMAQWGDIPVNRAEATVKSSPAWREHVGKIVEARRVANLAKVRMEYIRMKHMEHVNEEANHRAGARL